MVVLPLVLDVLFDDVFVCSNGTHEIASAPKALLLHSMTLSGELIVGTDRRFPFEETQDMGNRVLRRNLEKHMDMVGAGIGFQNLDFFLGCEEAEDFADLDSRVTVEHLLAVFWYNDHVILAVPDHVTLRFEGAHGEWRE